MSISRKIIALLVVGTSIFLGYFLVRPSPKTSNPHELKTVEIVTVTVKPIQKTAQLIGKIQSQQSSVLIAQTSGTLNIVTAAGKTVKQRDLLAKIDNINVERNYQLAQQEEALAKLQYQRVKKLFDGGILSKNAVEEKESVWIRAQEKVSTERIARDKLIITAPFDGVVGAFKFEHNAQVQAGDTVVPMYNPAKLMVKFDIPLPLVPALQNDSVVIVNDKPYLLGFGQDDCNFD